MTSSIASQQHLNTNFSLYRSVIHRILNLDIKISKKNFHPSIQHNGGRKIGVKNPKNFDPIWGFHPNFSFKNHQFLVISLIEDTIGVRSLAARSVYKEHY